MKTEWKPIKGFDGVYEISNVGEVKSHMGNSERVLHPTDNGNGYLIIGLSKNKVCKNFYIHRLVAQEFLGEIPPGMVVNHKDYNTKNNSVENLEIITQKQNVMYSVKNMEKPRKSNPRSGYKHIRYKKKAYEVAIDFKEKVYYVGRFSNLVDALNKREEMYEKIHYYR